VTNVIETLAAADGPGFADLDRLMAPGDVMEIGGPPGHGLPLAVGIALGLRARGLTGPRVWVVVGEAELDAGSNHEAMSFAGAAGLDRLRAVVIDNGSTAHRRGGGIASRFEVAGWSARTVDGYDHDALYSAPASAHPGRPHVVVVRLEPVL
jgi:transketolase